MQAFPRASLQQSLFWKQNRNIFVLFSREAASGLSRESLLRDAITETLGKLRNLHNEQYIIGWRWSTNGFYLAYTVRAERIEAYTVLHGYHVLL
jgi:hypothetical protein